MDPDKQRMIAGMGGKKAHKWTKAEASKAGKVLKGSKYQSLTPPLSIDTSLAHLFLCDIVNGNMPLRSPAAF